MSSPDSGGLDGNAVSISDSGGLDGTVASILNSGGLAREVYERSLSPLKTLSGPFILYSNSECGFWSAGVRESAGIDGRPVPFQVKPLFSWDSGCWSLGDNIGGD